MKAFSVNQFFSFSFLFSIIFINYYNPVSVYLTLIFNLSISFFMFVFLKKFHVESSHFIVVIPALIFSYVGFLGLYLGNVDLYIVGKYFRIFLSFILIYYIFKSKKWSLYYFYNCIALVLFFHVFFIYVQVVFPSISIPMASIFGMSSADNFFSEYSSRKMGLSSSFDTASFISILSFIFFTLSFKYIGQTRYLVLALFSFGASFMSSRLGMVLAVLVFLLLFVPAFLKSGSKVMLLLGVAIMSAVFYLSFDVIVSVVLHSIGSETANAAPVLNEYGTTGTVNALFGSHLLKLFELEGLEYIFGKAIDPDGTDIGYVKLIYHIGLIGTSLIFLMYFIAFINVRNMKFPTCRKSMVLQNFFLFFIVITFLINYKSLELYSRGSAELFVLLYVFLVSHSKLDFQKAG